MNKEQQKEAKEIENVIEEARQRINRECFNLLPYGVKIEFIGDYVCDVCGASYGEMTKSKGECPCCARKQKHV